MSETEQKLNSSEFVASSMTYLHNMEEDKYVEQSNCVQQKKESHIEQVGWGVSVVKHQSHILAVLACLVFNHF